MVGGEPLGGWHDGRVRRPVLFALMSMLVVLLPNVPSAHATVAPTVPPQTTTEGFDVETDCLSSLPPPECGSEDRGGAGQYLTFGAMILGMALIGWRIAVAVRSRDRALSPDA